MNLRYFKLYRSEAEKAKQEHIENSENHLNKMNSRIIYLTNFLVLTYLLISDNN